MNSAESAHFTELVSHYLEGELTAEQEGELLAFLQTSEGAARFLEMTRVDREIAGLLAAPVADDTLAALVLQDIGRMPAEAPPLFTDGERGALGPRGNHQSPTLSQGANAPRSPTWKGRIAGLAAAVLVGIGWLVYAMRGDHRPVVAHLKEVQGSVFVVGEEGRQPGTAGQPLSARQEVVTVGEGSSAVVEYPDATRLELGAETAVRQLVDVAKPADKRIFLAQGFLTVDAAPQPESHPLVVATPQAEVLVLGTRFTLESEAEATQVQVRTGKVQFTRKVDNKVIEVPQGTFAVATPDIDQFVPRPLPDGSQEPVPVIDVARGLRLAHKGGVASVAFTTDGRMLASCIWEPGAIRLWDLGAGKPTGPTELCRHKGAVWTVAFSPDGKRLCSGGNDKKIHLWDVAARKEVAQFEHKALIRAAAFAPDNQTLATGHEESVVRLRDPRTGRERAAFKENLKGGWAGVYCLAFSPDSRLLAIGLSDRNVRVREVPSGKVRYQWSGHTDFVRSVAFSADGKFLASASHNEVIVWDMTTGQKRYEAPGSSPVAFSHDGKVLAIGGPAPALWDAATGRVRAYIRGPRCHSYSLAFSPDRKTLALGGWLGVTLLDLSTTANR